jgi:release factor glutamine methyltransferase
MLLSNPPYVTEAEVDELAEDVRNYEPRAALSAGPDGMSAYRALLADAAQLLAPAAYVAVEVDPRRAAAVAALLAATLPAATIRRLPDLTQRDRVVEAVIAR